MLTVRSTLLAAFGVGFVLLFADMASAQGGVTWTQLSPANSPSARFVHATAYDEARQRVVLFGGSSGSSGLSDTWEWAGVNWTNVTPTPPGPNPSARWGHAMAHDAARSRVVLFGGLIWNPSTSTWVRFNDTWAWDGANWTDVAPALKPSPRAYHAMAYDAARQHVVLFGGQDSIGRLQDTWEWDGLNWTPAAPAQRPTARNGHHMAYDAARQRVVMFGGNSLSGPLQETWEWDGVDWTQATPAHRPSARWRHAMAYDVTRQRVVLFGGWNGNSVLQDTWEWDGVDWTQVTPSQRPLARSWHAMAYDGARVVLFGGVDNSSGALQDTWEYESLSPASFTTFGTGCPGSTGTPTLDAAPFSSPWTGDTFTVELTNLPPTSMAFMVTGLSNTYWAGALIQLPAPLMSWGMPGCTVYTDVVNSELLANTNGTAVWLKTIPNDANLIGLTFYNQGFVIDPGVNAMGAVVTNAGEATTGMR